jgi:hypothetical protein
MPIVGLSVGKATLRTQATFRKLFALVPAFPSAMQNFTAAFAAAAPAVDAPGGMFATLRAAPQLAVNMDAWLQDIGATELIPARCIVVCGRRSPFRDRRAEEPFLDAHRCVSPMHACSSCRRSFCGSGACTAHPLTRLYWSR